MANPEVTLSHKEPVYNTTLVNSIPYNIPVYIKLESGKRLAIRQDYYIIYNPLSLYPITTDRACFMFLYDEPMTKPLLGALDYHKEVSWAYADTDVTITYKQKQEH